MVGDEIMWRPECLQPPPPLRKNGPLAAQSNSPFSDSCYTLGAIIPSQLFPFTGNILSGL